MTDDFETTKKRRNKKSTFFPPSRNFFFATFFVGGGFDRRRLERHEAGTPLEVRRLQEEAEDLLPRTFGRLRGGPRGLRRGALCSAPLLLRGPGASLQRVPERR